MDDFTKRFNKVLSDSGLTGAQISDMLNIHPPTLIKYKTGKSLMSMQTLYNFCKTFDVSADWLLGLSDDSKELNVYDLIGEKPVINVAPPEEKQKRG